MSDIRTTNTCSHFVACLSTLSIDEQEILNFSNGPNLSFILLQLELMSHFRTFTYFKVIKMFFFTPNIFIFLALTFISAHIDFWQWCEAAAKAHFFFFHLATQITRTVFSQLHYRGHLCHQWTNCLSLGLRLVSLLNSFSIPLVYLSTPAAVPHHLHGSRYPAKEVI